MKFLVFVTLFLHVVGTFALHESPFVSKLARDAIIDDEKPAILDRSKRYNIPKHVPQQQQTPKQQFFHETSHREFQTNAHGSVKEPIHHFGPAFKAQEGHFEHSGGQSHHKESHLEQNLHQNYPKETHFEGNVHHGSDFGRKESHFSGNSHQGGHQTANFGHKEVHVEQNLHHGAQNYQKEEHFGGNSHQNPQFGHKESHETSYHASNEHVEFKNHHQGKSFGHGMKQPQGFKDHGHKKFVPAPHKPVPHHRPNSIHGHPPPKHAPIHFPQHHESHHRPQHHKSPHHRIHKRSATYWNRHHSQQNTGFGNYNPHYWSSGSDSYENSDDFYQNSYPTYNNVPNSYYGNYPSYYPEHQHNHFSGNCPWKKPNYYPTTRFTTTKKPVLHVKPHHEHENHRPLVNPLEHMHEKPVQTTTTRPHHENHHHDHKIQAVLNSVGNAVLDVKEQLLHKDPKRPGNQVRPVVAIDPAHPGVGQQGLFVPVMRPVVKDHHHGHSHGHHSHGHPRNDEEETRNNEEMPILEVIPNPVAEENVDSMRNEGNSVVEEPKEDEMKKQEDENEDTARSMTMEEEFNIDVRGAGGDIR
ncbi:histidine-rich glycoprotein-like [Culicoides brevitarsis]|uniref:histidine-rich glycoprotein-like n=1 Tax=Culicoides brevitarsis TaxID=469753 RepID=UPI00307B7C28